MTTIRVSDENLKKLNDLKTETEAKSIDEVISHLLEVNTKYTESKIVRLVECI